jgi:alkaline phosphatase D
VNFGVIGIDWEGGELALQIKDEAGAVVREQRVALDSIGAQ